MAYAVDVIEDIRRSRRVVEANAAELHTRAKEKVLPAQISVTTSCTRCVRGDIRPVRTASGPLLTPLTT